MEFPLLRSIRFDKIIQWARVSDDSHRFTLTYCLKWAGDPHQTTFQDVLRTTSDLLLRPFHRQQPAEVPALKALPVSLRVIFFENFHSYLSTKR